MADRGTSVAGMTITRSDGRTPNQLRLALELALRTADVVFLALPDSAAAELAPALVEALSTRRQSSRVASSISARFRNSLTEHFCHDEDDEGSEKSPASEEIYQGVSGCGKHGC